MKFLFVWILLFFLNTIAYSQTQCVVNNSLFTVGSICSGQTFTLSTNTLNYSCYTYGDLPTNLQNGLISYYPFCGNSFDENGWNNNLSVSGSTTLTADRFGNSSKAYDFNGTTSFMVGGNTGWPLGNSARTIAFWFYDRVSLSTGADSIASNLFCYGNNTTNGFFQVLHMAPSYSGAINVNFNGSSITTNTINATFNSWQFFAFVMDASSNYTTYINGNIAGIGTVTLNTGNLSVMIGESSLSWPAPKHRFNGKMDDLYIYTRDLSQSEILQIYSINTIPTTYSWSTGAITSSITVSPSTTTIYTVSATNGSNFCNATTTVVVNTCTGVEELSRYSSIQIYPNPVLSKISFKPEIEMEDTYVEIQNILGENVLSLPYSKEIDASKLTPGIYILNLTIGNKKFNYRFVKE